MAIRTTSNTSSQSAPDIETLCPVCGYAMDDRPEDYNICPSCGTEFGVNDVNSTIEDLRELWLDGGPAWWSPTDPIPSAWNPVGQLRGLLRVQQELARKLG
jgi:hypothetical protein